LGITAEDIANGADGFVMNIGKLRQVNTTIWPDGTVLYCDPTTAGNLTSTKPSSPNLALPVAFVVHSAANGVLAIRVSILDENALNTPTLAQVTTAGNTTTNAITVGGLTVDASVLTVASFSGTNASTRVSINNTTATPNAGFNLLANGVPKWSLASYGATSDFTFYNDALLSDALFIKGNTNNVLIGRNTDAGYKLDVNGTARTSQLHTFVQGTYLNALTTNYFYTADTGTGTYGGLALKNSINNYSALIYTGRSGANNAIVFEHLAYSGTPTSQGSQKFGLTWTTFGVANNGTYGHTLTVHQRLGSSASYPLVITNQINSTNSGVGILMQTADSTATGPINSASIVSWKQNLTAPNVTSDMRFSTISDAANTLSEKMRISSAGNLLIGTTTDGTAKLRVAGSITAASALAQGVYFNNTLVQAAASDVLTAFQITPTFTVDPTLLHNAYWMRFTGAYSPSVYNNPNNNATTIDLSNSFANTFQAIGLRIRHTYSNVQVGYGILLESASYYGIVQTSTASTNFLAGKTVIGSSSTNLNNEATLNVINGTNGGIKVGGVGGNSQHLIISHSEAGATFSSIRNTYNSASSSMLIDVAGQNNLRLWGTGNVVVGGTTDAGYKLDVNGSARVKGTGTTDSTIALLVQNNTGRLLLQTDDGGFTRIGGPTARLYVGVESGGAGARLVVNGAGLFSDGGIGNAGGFYIDQGGTSSASRTIWYDGSGTPKNLITGNGDNYITSGNFGIGTTSPTDILHIVSGAAANIFGRISSTSANGTAAWVAQNDQVDNVVYRVFGSGASGTQMGISLARSASLLASLGGSGKFLIGTYSSTDLVFGTSDTERMRLVDSTGNFLVGTTTDLGNKLEVSGTVNATAYKINNVIGYTGILNIPTNPPGMQNVDIQSGIVVNIF
jgi:hypothetical protein